MGEGGTCVVGGMYGNPLQPLNEVVSLKLLETCLKKRNKNLAEWLSMTVSRNKGTLSPSLARSFLFSQTSSPAEERAQGLEPVE